MLIVRIRLSISSLFKKAFLSFFLSFFFFFFFLQLLFMSFFTADDVMEFFESSKLPKNDLARIW